jgi:large subunit ribosomal protein L49
MPINCGRFKTSEKFQGVEHHPEVEVITNPPEWKYVEDLLGKKLVPLPETKKEYPSGWQPPNPEKYKSLPYFVKRTRNYMLPVFLNITFRGDRRRTFIKNIEGDIWQLEQDLHKIIRDRIGNNPVYSQINEMNRSITIKGDYVTLVQKHFYRQGL